MGMYFELSGTPAPQMPNPDTQVANPQVANPLAQAFQAFFQNLPINLNINDPDQENSSMPADGGYRSVATVTAPVHKASDESSISEGTVMQAELIEKDGNYYLKAGEKLYEMNTHASGRKIDSEAAAVRLAQDYLRYGYITTPKAVVELSEPVGDAPGNWLAISAVNKYTGTVNTAQLGQIGSDTYLVNGHEFRAPSDAEAVKAAIAYLENIENSLPSSTSSPNPPSLQSDHTSPSAGIF